MPHRPRLLLAVLAAVALLALPTTTLAPSHPGAQPATDADALATRSAAVQSAAAHRPTRSPYGVDSDAVVLLLIGTLAGVGFISSLIGRTRRRLTDVGDRWRCLLFGAPPLLAYS